MNRFEHQYNLGICDEVGIRGIDYDMAKQCALIAVNEILNNSIDYNAYDGVSENDIWSDNEYWKEVKQVIEKL